MKTAKAIKTATKRPLFQDQPAEIIRVLLIEDNPRYDSTVRIMLDTVRGTRFDVVRVKGLSEGLQHLGKGGVDVVLLDRTVPNSQGINIIDKIYAQAPHVPIIVLAATEDDGLAVAAVQKGVQDYLVTEQADGTLLAHAIHYAIEKKRIENHLRKYSMHLEEFAERTETLAKENEELKQQITECKQTEEALRESEERHRTFFEQSNDVIFVIGRDGKILDFNQASLDFFGYTREEMWEMKGQALYADFTARKRIQQLIEQEGSVRDFEVRLRKQDGTEMDCLLTATERQADDGSIVEYQGIIRDITGRKRSEEQLRGQALIFENIHDGIIVTDLEGTIMSWNPAAERMFGYYQDEVLRKTIGMLATKVLKGTLRDGRWTGEIDFIRKDGTDGVCETTVIPLRDGRGTITAVIEVCRDITVRKRSEESLQQSYDQLRETLIATVNTLASTIEMRDPYTADHQRRVTLLACAIAEEMGLTDDQFDGLRMAGLIHDLGKINVPAEILSKPGRINEIEFSIIRFHPQICHDILKTIDLPWPVAKIVLQHHERLDGSGYPQGLKGNEIMLEARILAVADVVEAMASHRPYRPALGIERALQEIIKNKGTLYDPGVVDICVKLLSTKRFTFD